MAAEALPLPRASRSARLFAQLADYWALTKPEVNFLILITTFAGFQLASGGRLMMILHTLLGTLLVAGGASALNQFLERSFDAQMRRTARRPLASGRLEPSHVRAFGTALSLAGTIYLVLVVNVLTSLLAAIALLGYLYLYTPAKRKTPLCTLVGALAGAIPPLIGWAAARGRLDPGAWVLYALLFLWQFPHFMAIAWMYREDYSRAGYLILPVGGNRDRIVILQSFFVSMVLIPISLIPTLTGSAGFTYCLWAFALGSVFLMSSARFAFQRSTATARQLLAASIIYLPAVLALMVLDRTQA
jgi:heme o synthase